MRKLLQIGGEVLDTTMRDWRDERAHRLYSLAASSGDPKIRDEAVHFLGALERAGSDDAAWAMNSLKMRGKGKDRPSLTRGSEGKTGPGR